MESLPRVTAKIVIVETGETHNVEFTDVIEMLGVIDANVRLAQTVYERPISVSEVDVHDESDDAYFAFSYTDTNELYMTVNAHRHLCQ